MRKLISYLWGKHELRKFADEEESPLKNKKCKMASERKLRNPLGAIKKSLQKIKGHIIKKGLGGEKDD